MNLEQRRLRVSGGDLAYLDLGDPEAPAVLLLHGFPTSSYLWRRETLLFSARMRAVAPDLLGYGNSERPPEADLSLMAQVGYVTELLDALGLERVAAVGHGFGGGIAQRLAFEGRARTLVLLNAVAFDAWPTDVDRTAARAKTAPEVERVVRSFLDGGIAHAGRLSDEDVAAYLGPWLRDPEAFARAAAAIDGGGLEDAQEKLDAYEDSTFVVWGEDDPYLPSALGERLGEVTPGSTVALLPGCSHLVNEDAPQTVGPLVFEFLRYRYLGETHAKAHEPVTVFLEPPTHRELLNTGLEDD